MWQSEHCLITEHYSLALTVIYKERYTKVNNFIEYWYNFEKSNQIIYKNNVFERSMNLKIRPLQM